MPLDKPGPGPYRGLCTLQIIRLPEPEPFLYNTSRSCGLNPYLLSLLHPDLISSLSSRVFTPHGDGVARRPPLPSIAAPRRGLPIPPTPPSRRRDPPPGCGLAHPGGGARGGEMLRDPAGVVVAAGLLAQLEQPAAQGDDPPRRVRLRALAGCHGAATRRRLQPRAHTRRDHRRLYQDSGPDRRKVSQEPFLSCSLMFAVLSG